jgi:hypothetical protein
MGQCSVTSPAAAKGVSSRLGQAPAWAAVVMRFSTSWGGRPSPHGRDLDGGCAHAAGELPLGLGPDCLVTVGDEKRRARHRCGVEGVDLDDVGRGVLGHGQLRGRRDHVVAVTIQRSRGWQIARR